MLLILEAMENILGCLTINFAKDDYLLPMKVEDVLEYIPICISVQDTWYHLILNWMFAGFFLLH